jgi:tRNA A-37 threonylcarbamoyl transferase component Bud32
MRRRPSGEPPPLPRKIGVSGRIWILLAVSLVGLVGLVLVSTTLGTGFDRFDFAITRRIVSLRSGGITSLVRVVATVLASRWTVRILRVATVIPLIGFRRWRHLLTFLGSVIAVEIATYELAIFVASPRPLGVDIIGRWKGFAFPSRPVAAVAVTLIGIAYTMLPPGRPRSAGKWATGTILAVVCLVRLYLAVDGPTDQVAAIILGVGIPVVMFRFFTPNEVFPLSYRKGKAAHLDVGGQRGDAIRRAIHDQLGLTVLDVKPIGLEGSGGSTPLRLRVAATDRAPERYVFAKLYAKTHVRADRWYKLGRTILYGALEDEAPFQTVRRFVEYEDYTLLLLNHLGIPTPEPLGIVEITPEREYMIVMEFFEGAREIGEASIGDDEIEGGLRLVRRLWNAGLAHRDVKPANLMVRDGRVLLIDVFFVQVRPSPWRQAVDLANMMLVLALRSEPERVYRLALKYFTEDEMAEAFAATRGVASPTQLRAMLEKDGRDLVGEFRSLAPARTPVSIQRWSMRRIVLTLTVLAAALLVVLALIGAWKVVV